MLFIVFYLPLKYMFFKLHLLNNIYDAIVVNTVCDILFFTLFTFLWYKFTYISRLFLIGLENIFWIYFIYKSTFSIINSSLLLVFIVFYRYIFMYKVTPVLLLILLFKEIVFFIIIVMLNSTMGNVGIDFLSFIFSALSYYLSFGKFLNFVLSMIVNLFIVFILSLKIFQKLLQEG